MRANALALNETIVPSDDLCGDVVLRGHLPQNAGPSSKVQSQNADYTPERSHFFKKKG